MTNPRLDLSRISIKDIPTILPMLSPADQAQLLAELTKLDELKAQKAAQTRFMSFVRAVWPTFIAGQHHAKVAEAFERVAAGTCKRLIINMPPRHSKSEFASYLLPAWFLGKYPHKKVIQCSHTAELAVGFGRKVRNLVDTEEYHKIFPDLALQSDSKAAGRWNTSKGGDYFAIGVGGAVTGKGADCAYFSCKVLTQAGIVSIADVRIGDLVYGYDHRQNKPVWTRVVAGSTQFKPELVDIAGVLVTPEHRVYTRHGYVRAGNACTVAVRNLRDVLPARPQGASPCGAADGEGRRRDQGLLFRGVQPHGEALARMHLRGAESPTRQRVQGVLPERQAGGADLHPVWGWLHAAYVRAQEVSTAAWGNGQRFLFQGLLRGAPAVSPSGAYAVHGFMPDLRYAHSGDQAFLLHGVLQPAESPRGGVFRGLERGEACDKETRQGRMRLLRAGETAHRGAPHRPRRDQQHPDEPHNALRAVPHAISYADRGASARDYAGVLSGEGAWVVDVQTGTHNFFLAPDYCTSEEDFLRDAVLVHNCLIIDDPHSEQEAALAESNPDIYDKTYEWYTSGPRQRLQPGGSIVIVQTRWSKRDLTGQVLKAAAQRGGEEWEVIEFPAIMPSGVPLWPEFWSLKELSALREELPNSKWMAQYQQAPTSDVSAIVKREWWRTWEKDDPPDCEFTLMAWDTAFEKSQRADYSALTTWGVFYQPDDNGQLQANIILLNAFRERMEFPRLKQKAIEHYRDWEPDSVIIEKKGSGAPLIYELRAMGIPVQEYTPSRGNDKISRLNAVSDIFASGRVWAPRTRWAEEVIDEVASFPGGDHDDLTDTVSMALLRFRKGGYVSTNLDEPDEIPYFRRRAQGYY